jgi:antitoxin (DNA-binding transcriptional repressor) of toxin-antitoxin stability system
MYIMKIVTLTELRRNIFQLVDEVLATGEPIVIDRKGARLVLRGETQRRSEESEAERAERWRRFWAEPPPAGWEDLDLSLEALDKDKEAGWRWDKDPELDR